MQKVKYSGIILLSLVGTLLLWDAYQVSGVDDYALYMGMFFDIPVGLVLIVLSYHAWKTEKERSFGKSLVAMAGGLVGLVLSVFALVLFSF